MSITALAFNHIDRGHDPDQPRRRHLESSRRVRDLIHLDGGAAINNLAGATFTVTGGGGADDGSHPRTAQRWRSSTPGLHRHGLAARALSVPFANSGSVVVQQGAWSWAMPRIRAR